MPRRGWSDEHRQILFQDDPAHRGADGVSDVRVDNTVLPRWLTNPHLDKITCLSVDVKENWPASNIAYAVVNKLTSQAWASQIWARSFGAHGGGVAGRQVEHLRRHEPSRNAGMSSKWQGQPHAEIQGPVINTIIAAVECV